MEKIKQFEILTFHTGFLHGMLKSSNKIPKNSIEHSLEYLEEHFGKKEGYEKALEVTIVLLKELYFEDSDQSESSAKYFEKIRQSWK